jgi:peptide/nickel transport system permease protein
MTRLLRSPKIVIGLCLSGVFGLLAIIGPFLAPYSPNASASTTVSVPQPPSAAHLLGTTQIQQDVLSQLLAGGRSTILVSLVAGVAATVLAVLFGVTAGYFAGWADDLLSMLANIFLVLPALPLLIVIFGFLGKGANPNDLVIGGIISVTGWAFGARQLRAQTLSMRHRDFVDSARIVGEKSWRIMTFEILPNLIPVVATSFLFTVIYGVGTYTALSFLGVINTSHWSWGTMLYWAQSAQAAQQVHLEWWWFMPPGLAVGLFGTGLAMLNFGIDEYVNPRLRGAGGSGVFGRAARRAGLPRRPRLGLTPVLSGASRRAS